MYPLRRAAATMLVHLVLALLLGACAPLNAPEEDAFLRIRNESSYDLVDVLVSSPGLEEFFGTIAPGGTTEYRPVARLYRYAFFEATVEGRISRLVPIDYVGETPLRPGSYTFVLGVADSGELGFLGVVRERSRPATSR